MQPSAPTPDAAFDQAGQLYRSGQLAAAETELRRILAAYPDHILSWQTLGGLLMQQHRLSDAADVYVRYVAVDPNSADAHYNLGVAHAMLGRFDHAIDSFLAVTRLRPTWAAAFSNLGNAYSGVNQFDEAEEAYRRAVEIEPGFAGAWSNLGGLLQRSGKHEAAIDALLESLKHRPNHPETLFNYAHAMRSAGRLSAAIESLKRVVQLRPDYFDAWQSLASFQGTALRYDEAVVSATRCVQMQPSNPGGFNTLGLLLREQGKKEEALRTFQHTLELDPDYFQGYVNAGMVFHELGRLAEAIGMQREAIRRNPKSGEAHLNLGNALRDAGELPQALESYRTATTIGPPSSFHHLLLALHYLPIADPPEVLAEHRRWVAALGPIAPITPPNDFDPQRKLRVGFVSADFRRHAVGYNLLPLFDHLDRANFEYFIYNAAKNSDALTEHYRKTVDHWTPINALNDEQAATKIAADRIDLLMDLSVHSGDNRLELFAYKPAPLQGSFAGYPGTTGLPQIDFRLSDPYLDPPGQTDAFYSEKTIRLDHSFWCYRAADDSPAVNPLPALSNGYITIGYLGSYVKASRPSLTLWAKVMNNLPNSRLLMIARPGVHCDQTMAFLQTLGIDPSRVEFLNYQTRVNYLKTYHRVDLSLDSIPYNSHTTGLDGLWMGVPTISTIGPWAVSRAGFSQLSNLGLTELVAKSDDEFVDIATTLATDLPRLANLRENLRSRMQRSPLMDEVSWAKNIQQTLRDQWQQRCAAARSQ